MEDVSRCLGVAAGITAAAIQQTIVRKRYNSNLIYLSHSTHSCVDDVCFTFRDIYALCVLRHTLRPIRMAQTHKREIIAASMNIV